MSKTPENQPPAADKSRSTATDANNQAQRDERDQVSTDPIALPAHVAGSGALDRLVDHQTIAGTHGVTVGGTTGEGWSLNLDETVQITSRVVAAAFNQRRKMLRASLKGLSPAIEDHLKAAGIAPTERAEQVSLEAFCALARSLETA